jgi:hypothetical protein
MSRETAGEDALELAARRLDRALGALEQRLAGGELFAARDPGLEAELERLRAREKELEAAGAEASATLGRAIEEIRTALGGTQG